MSQVDLFQDDIPDRARVPSSKALSQNMINHSIVDAGVTLKRFALKAWGFDFDSLEKGDNEGARLPVSFNNLSLTIKVYRPLTGNGRFVRLTLDADLIRIACLSVGDVMFFDKDSDGKVILSVERPKLIPQPLIGRRRSLKVQAPKIDIPFGFRSEGAIQKHERWERTRCGLVAKIVKQLELKKFGRLCCHGCGMESLKTYGVEVIEAHHRVPLSEIHESRIPKPSDFDLLCPSCHRLYIGWILRISRP